MGFVYRAHDEQAGKPVALKILALRRPSDLERFEREALLLRELQHPAIPAYISHGARGSGETYLVMEWVDGRTLAEVLESGRLGVGATLRLGLRVAEALAVAHRRGVVHRDIKPRNIMVDGEDVQRVRLMDFGVARDGLGATLTRPGACIGTPGYMAPEQARGEGRVDARADVFSLGCVLFECLTGRPAFAADDLMALMAKVVVDDPPLASSLDPGVPPQLDDLLRRMLAKVPDERPLDGATVVAAIEAISECSRDMLREVVPLSRRVLTKKELRLVSVVVASHRGSDSTVTAVQPDSRPPLAHALSQLGARAERLADGTVLASWVGTGLAMDQAGRAAQAALLVRSELPSAAIAIATGRGLLAGSIPVGEVIDRAVARLRALEQQAQPTADTAWIALDELTAGLLDASYEVRGHERSLYLVGRQEPLETPRLLLGRVAPFVGRERDLDFIDSCCEESFEGPAPSVVLVTAPAGAGKSRLIREYLARAQTRRAKLGVWIARADSIGAGSPFALVSQCIRRAAGIRDDEPLEVRYHKLQARVLRHVAEPEADRVASFLGELSGTWFNSDERPSLRAARQDAMLMREEIERAWVDFLAAECEAEPLLLVLEDLQWGDLPSMKLIGSALRKLPEAPLFIVAAGRPEVHDIFPGLLSDADLQEVRLSKLNRSASRAMVRDVLGETVDEETLERLVLRAAGNPLYLEELIRAVARSGRTLPETLVAMMAARLEALDPEARRVLRAASVFGEVFWRGGLVSMLEPGAGAALDRWLDILTDEELVEPRRESRFRGEREYAFRHALFREAVYATLVPSDQTAAHRAAALWLEQAGETDPLILAEHFEIGGEPARAAAQFRRAAEQALEGSDYDAAWKRARRGIECGAEGEDFAALRYVHGEVHLVRGENVEAERCGTEVLSLTPRGSAPWCWAAGTTFGLRIQLGDLEGASEIVREFGATPPEHGAELAYVRASAHAIPLLSLAGQHATARAFFARVKRLIAELSDAGDALHAWGCLATCHFADFEGHCSLQLASSLEGERHFASARSDAGVALLRTQRGRALLALGDYESALTVLSHARDTSNRLGAAFNAALAGVYEAEANARLGELERARSLAEAAAVAFYQQGSPVHFGMARSVLAGILVVAGDHPGAERELNEALLVLESVPALRCTCQGLLGEILLRRGATREALALFDEAHTTLRQLGTAGPGELRLRVALAEALATRGERSAAQEMRQSAVLLLRERASRIAEAQLRDSYLTRVAEHRDLMRSTAVGRE